MSHWTLNKIPNRIPIANYWTVSIIPYSINVQFCYTTRKARDQPNSGATNCIQFRYFCESLFCIDQSAYRQKVYMLCSGLNSMHSNKKDLTQLFSYLQNDVVRVNASLGQGSKRACNLGIRTRQSRRKDFNAIVRPIRQYNSS